MIPEKIKLEILTPQAEVYSEKVSSIQLPGSEGYFGVFPGHTPFLTSLGIGKIKVRIGDKEDYFATTGGIADVQSGAVAVLAETAEAAQEIDVSRAEESRKRAQERLQEGRTKWDVDRAQMALLRALNRLQIASLK